MSNRMQASFMLCLLDAVLGTLHLPSLDIKHLAMFAFWQGNT